MAVTHNCGYRGVVDFGDGPVTVRCTKVGEHDEHEVSIILGKGPREALRHNIFEDGEDVTGD